MNWLELTVQTKPDSIEEVANALTSAGFSDLVLEDQQEYSEFLEENRAYWDYIDEDLQQQMQGLSQIKLYLEEDNTDALQRLKNLLAAWQSQHSDWGSLALSVNSLAETNWEESWKENYPPQPVGEKLLVLPYWDAENITDNRLPIILDPGLTFGTGAHPSTQMVMEVMERTVKPGMQCLDLGSGSGILSIAALRLGAESATGVDIDPKAEDIARENSAYNGFSSPAFTALTGNVLQDKDLMNTLSGKHYDVVLVNIVADVIIGLAPVLPAFLAPDTTLICSGILDERLGDVVAALSGAGLQITEILSKEDWRCTVCRRTL